VFIPCCLGAVLVLLVSSATGTPDAKARPGVPGKAFVYEAVHALLIVKDKATQEESGIKWDGFGRLVEKMGPSGPAGPPILLGRGGATYPVSISGSEYANGDETQTDSGKPDPCSGTWNEGSSAGAITLEVTKAGAGKLKVIWHIPTGFASPHCGRLYDQFAGGTELTTMAAGEVGDRHLTLTIAEKKVGTSKSGTTQQTIMANGKVVLDLK
jgi:hypothetical protein